MIIYIFILSLIAFFIFLLKKQELKNIKKTNDILKSFIDFNFLPDVSEDFKVSYDKVVDILKKQNSELTKSTEELLEYKEELEVTYNSLLSKSKQLEYSNHILEERFENLSNINALSRTVLSIMDLDKIITKILDAYFVLTGAKHISLYLWEGGKLINKRTKGKINFNGELNYSEEILSQFSKEDFDKVYSELKRGFLITHEEQIIATPLTVKGKDLGVIYIIEEKNKLIQSDEDTLSALAIQVAIAINNAQIYSDLVIKEKMSQELEVASRIQKKILPKKIRHIFGLELSTFFKPAKEIGGDYYDYSQLDENSFSITIADVSGKGVPAAFLMALGRSVLKTLELQGEDPASNLKKLNRLIFADMSEDMFITMIHTKYNYKTKTLVYSNAGHNPIIFYNSEKHIIETHFVKGVAIGFLEDYNYKQSEIKLNIGDIVVFYTDGITEAENPNKFLFGIERLKNIILKYSHLSAREIKYKLLYEINKFQNGFEQSDDITFVVIKREL